MFMYQQTVEARIESRKQFKGSNVFEDQTGNYSILFQLQYIINLIENFNVYLICIDTKRAAFLDLLLDLSESDGSLSMQNILDETNVFINAVRETPKLHGKTIFN